MRLRHILVVDDSDADFETVQDAARRSGRLNPVLRASSGTECLRLLRDAQRSRDGLPVLVLLDLNTPGDDGRDALREVRSDPVLGTLPVVVVSASANPRDLQFCYANGANAYHVKPTAHAMHLKLLQEILDYWLGSVVLPA
jgi:CheY-like chemotaxis protein